MEIERHWDAIVTPDPEKRDKVEQSLDHLKNQEFKTLLNKSLEKTEFEEKALSDALRLTKEVGVKYGGVGKDMPSDHIYVVSPESMAEHEDARLIGLYNSYYNRMVEQRTGSSLEFLNFSIHELLHFQQYRSFRPDKEKEDARIHRSGLTIHENIIEGQSEKNREHYFDELNEAITAYHTKEIRESIKDDPAYRIEVEAVNEIKDWFIYATSIINPKADLNKVRAEAEELYAFRHWREMLMAIRESNPYPKTTKDNITYILGKISGLTGKDKNYRFQMKDFAVFSEYSEYRTRFGKLVGEISEKSGLSEHEVRDYFFKASYSGRLLPLSNLVEKSLGKGSFRKIAEDFKKKG